MAKKKDGLDAFVDLFYNNQLEAAFGGMIIAANGPQYVVKFRGQQITLYRGREYFDTEKAAKGCIANFFGYSWNVWQILDAFMKDNIAINPEFIIDYRTVSEVGKRLAKKLLADGQITVERIR